MYEVWGKYVVWSVWTWFKGGIEGLERGSNSWGESVPCQGDSLACFKCFNFLGIEMNTSKIDFGGSWIC